MEVIRFRSHCTLTFDLDSCLSIAARSTPHRLYEIDSTYSKRCETSLSCGVARPLRARTTVRQLNSIVFTASKSNQQILVDYSVQRSVVRREAVFIIVESLERIMVS